MFAVSVTHHRVAPLSSFPIPDTRFNYIHVNIVCPLPPSNGFTYLLTCIDRFTRWPEAIPMSDITTSSVGNALISSWISQFGAPSLITTERGRQFELALWKQLMSVLGTTRTTSYHPQANGLVECFHRQLKCASKAQPNSVMDRISTTGTTRHSICP